MNALFIVVLGALLAANPVAGAGNPTARTPASSITVPNPNDPVETEYRKLLEDDDKAQEEVDGWIKENQAFAAKGAGLEQASLSLRIEQRFDPVRKAYEDFLLRHSDHARARVAYGSMLNDLGYEVEAVTQWEKARVLDPNDPGVLNNLANYYGHRGPVTNAFAYLERAIQLKPGEPLYYQNLAIVVFLYRLDAKEYYHIDEAQVFQKALDLYGKARRLAPKDFVLAQEWAQTYYGVKPPRYEEALAAWHEVLALAGDRLQEEGVLIHIARNEISMGRFQSASNRLAQVTNEVYQVLKARVLKNLNVKEAQAKTPETVTNAPPAKGR